MTSTAWEVSSEPLIPPPIATTAALAASVIAAPARKPVISPRLRSELTGSSRRLRPSSNAEEAAQGDPDAQRGDHDRRAGEQRDQLSKADGREVVDQGEVLRERVDDCHLPHPE